MANTLLSKAYESGYISKAQMEKAEKYKRETGVNDETAIREMKILSEDMILDMYENIYHYHKETDSDILDTAFPKHFTYKQLTRYSFIPVKENDTVKIMTAQPAELLYAEDLVRDVTGYKGNFEYSLISLSVLSNLLEYVFKENAGNVDTSQLEGLGDELSAGNIYDISESDSSVIVNLINKILREAIENKISDPAQKQLQMEKFRCIEIAESQFSVINRWGFHWGPPLECCWGSISLGCFDKEQQYAPAGKPQFL